MSNQREPIFYRSATATSGNAGERTLTPAQYARWAERMGEALARARWVPVYESLTEEQANNG